MVAGKRRLQIRTGQLADMAEVPKNRDGSQPHSHDKSCECKRHAEQEPLERT